MGMAILRSERIVHLNSSGEVIWEEWPHPSERIEDEQATAQVIEWQRKTPQVSAKKLSLPVIASTVEPPKRERGCAFGYDYSSMPRGRKFKRFGQK